MDETGQPSWFSQSLMSCKLASASMCPVHRFVASWHHAGHDGAGELRLAVDGTPLAEMIAVVEASSAQAEGHPDLAGSYAGLAGWACPNDLKRHFLGGPESHLHCGPHDKTVLMGCQCGEAGCWPLMAAVTVDDDIVRWAEFEQPHRRGRWSYEGFELVFDRVEYGDALLSAQRQRDQPADQP